MRLARLSKLTIVPGPNPHRCTGAGILSHRYDSGSSYYDEFPPLPELVQCDSYRGHPDGEHICVEAVKGYEYLTVEWRVDQEPE